MMTRRKFEKLFGLTLGSLLVSGWMSCSKVTDLIGNLRGILQSVEKALAALSLLSGLLPDAINTAAKYLLAVCQFVDDVAHVLENTSLADSDKARQILSWASGLVVPIIPPPIGPIVGAVAAAVDKFLSFFGTNVQGAGAQARSANQNVPNMTLKPEQMTQLRTIEEEAARDKQAVSDWQKKALATPH